MHQGESNTNDKEWPKKVKGVYENLLKDLGFKADDVPLLTGDAPMFALTFVRLARPIAIGSSP